MYKAFTFKMHPNTLDKIKLNQNIGSSLLIYNYHLNIKKKLHETSNKSLSLKDMKKGLVNLQKEYEQLKEADSCFGEIIRQLEYKCCWQGKKLIKVSTYYASSQIYNVCKN